MERNFQDHDFTGKVICVQKKKKILREIKQQSTNVFLCKIQLNINEVVNSRSIGPNVSAKEVFLKYRKETPALVFSSEFCEIFKNNFFIEHLRWLLLKHRALYTINSSHDWFIYFFN